MLKYIFFCIPIFISSFIDASETDEIYWETPEYLSKLETEEAASKIQYVYHLRMDNFKGNWILPLNVMKNMDGFAEIYEKAITKYKGREHLLSLVIPTLNCLWNDVVFLSPIHPHKHYEEYKRIGFTSKNPQFFKIPIEVLKEKQVTVWKWQSYKKYPQNDPIYESVDSYCPLNIFHYQELNDLPEATKEFYESSFDPAHPEVYPRFNWYFVPHILCLDPIDISDERITIINCEDPIEPYP